MIISRGGGYIQRIRSDRLSEELWSEICSIVQEAVTKMIPKKKKLKEANWLFEEALEKFANRRDAKSKEKGKDIFTQLNAEFQRTARRDNNTILNEQCKEIKKNSRMGN